MSRHIDKGDCDHDLVYADYDESENRIRVVEACHVCGVYWTSCYAKRERPEFRYVWHYWIDMTITEAFPQEDDGQLWWGPVGEWWYSGPFTLEGTRWQQR